MRIRSLVLLVASAGLALGSASAVSAAPGNSQASHGDRYYLALGDSLSQGVQPDSSGASVMTNQGYVDDLYTAYRTDIPHLKLVKLGCPGETTGTMIAGGVCPASSYGQYGGAATQLAAAVSFLRAHRGHIALVTIDIGANNVDGCIGSSGIDPTCIGSGITSAGADLARILTALRVADPSAKIVGMNYYDPFLAAWLTGPTGKTLAEQSIGLSDTFNGVLANAFGASRVPVADVATAFHTDDYLTLVPPGLPLDVATICSLTWMCAPSPVGPNIHANAAGYKLIAATFATTVGALD